MARAGKNPALYPYGGAGPSSIPKVRRTTEPALFPYGVGANDATATSVKLWTQTSARRFRLLVSTDPTFATVTKPIRGPVPTGHDGTILVPVSGLTPATTYYYEFQGFSSGAVVSSRVGTFQTAPDAGSNVDVHFAFSGDQDGTINGSTGSPCWNDFETFQAVQDMAPQFYVNLGDTIYSDSSCLATPNTTLGDYRSNYKQNLSYDALRNLRAAAGFYTIWDDHEVRDNWNSQTVDPTLLHNGRQAFEEYDAVHNWSPTLGIYRHFRWSRNAEIFVLDERSFRTEEADTLDVDGDGTPDCYNPELGGPDLAPTLSQTWRDFFASLIPGTGLEIPVPAQCTADLFDSTRTMLGDAQRQQFETDLLASTATFKLVINEDQIEQYYALPYDRWEGFQGERDQVLHFIDDNNIKSVDWLTTDVHAFMAHTVDYYNENPGDYGGVQGMVDYSVGPVATEDCRSEMHRIVGDDTASEVRAFLINVNETTCAELGGDGNPGAPFYGSGDVTIDAATRTLHIRPFDYTNFPIAGNGVNGTGRDYYCYDFSQTAAP